MKQAKRPGRGVIFLIKGFSSDMDILDLASYSLTTSCLWVPELHMMHRYDFKSLLFLGKKNRTPEIHIGL